MREEAVEYVHLPSGSDLPTTNVRHRRVIVIIDQQVDEGWQDRVSGWIVDSGCLFMMAWGNDCSSWDDSVDHANLRKFDYEEVPDGHFVMTTWHEDEPFEEVLFFNQMCAFHPTIDLVLVTILDISEEDRREQIMTVYRQERDALENDSYIEPTPTNFLSRVKRWAFGS